GQTDAERAAWLRRILAHNLADEVRRLGAAVRDVGRERSLEAALDESSARLEAWLTAARPSPGEQAARNEELLRMSEALERLREALAGWLEAAEAGRSPDEGEYLARYPEFASELARCFADWRRFPRPAGAPAAGAPPVVEGEQLGDFCLLREVGRGGMGVV